MSDLIARLTDSHAYQNELSSNENREYAALLMQRLRAFLEAWHERYYEEGVSNPKASFRAMNKEAHLLSAIGGTASFFPNQNDDGTPRPGSYLITLSNALGWQNVRIFSKSESLFANMKLQVDLLEMGASSYPNIPKPPEGFEDDENFEIDKGRIEGLLNQALQHRMAIQTMNEAGGIVPLAMSPLTAKLLTAVMGSRTEEDWEYSASHDDFWTCSVDEFQQAGTSSEAFSEALRQHAQARGLDEATALSIAYDWGIRITVVGVDEKEIAYCQINGRKPLATVSTNQWFGDKANGSARFDDDCCCIPLGSIPRATAISLSGKQLDEVVNHWMTSGLGTQVAVSRIVSEMTREMIEITLTPGKGPVILLNASSTSRKLLKLKDPAQLRKLVALASS